MNATNSFGEQTLPDMKVSRCNNECRNETDVEKGKYGEYVCEITAVAVRQERKYGMSVFLDSGFSR
jgi:hypothetical protein